MARQQQNTITKTYFAQNGAEFNLIFPARFEVCGRCDGHGMHTNPVIDGNGLSREDFDNDPEFEEGYFSGVYDIQCECCHGARVVPVVDESKLTARQRTKLVLVEQQEEDNARERRVEWESERWLRAAEGY
jgi:hypothetical protein